MDDDVKLRDQFAIAALQALIQQYKQITTTGISFNGNGNGSSSYANVSGYFSTTETMPSEMDRDYIARIEKKIEMITDLSYKIADQMRKSRIKVFE
jgi:hypothetical protein